MLIHFFFTCPLQKPWTEILLKRLDRRATPSRELRIPIDYQFLDRTRPLPWPSPGRRTPNKTFSVFRSLFPTESQVITTSPTTRVDDVPFLVGTSLQMTTETHWRLDITIHIDDTSRNINDFRGLQSRHLSQYSMYCVVCVEGYNITESKKTLSGPA